MNGIFTREATIHMDKLFAIVCMVKTAQSMPLSGTGCGEIHNSRCTNV